MKAFWIDQTMAIALRLDQPTAAINPMRSGARRCVSPISAITEGLQWVGFSPSKRREIDQ
jgi:hypothetical protein